MPFDHLRDSANGGEAAANGKPLRAQSALVIKAPKGRNVIAQGKRESAPPCCESAIHLLKPCRGDTSHSAAAGAAALDSRFRGNDNNGGNDEILKGNLPQNT
ncbi:MAG: hypothetical protein ACR2P4_02005 [Gammaproteobacteria bacterium]